MNEKILVINDDESLLELMEMYLMQKGYQVSTAINGELGIEQANKQKPDLILLDVMMPGIDGYETCKRLKAQQETKEIPVIFLSSLTDPKDKIKGLEAGGVDFISRASDQGELLARVQTHLKISALTRELMKANKELVEKQKHLDEDLAAAAHIQLSLLPRQIRLPKQYNMTWKCIACEEVGGDVFNVLPIDDSLFVFYILDVSGHGVSSAMVTVSVSQYIQQLLENVKLKKETLPLKQIIKNLNKEFPLERFDKFFTIFYMLIDIKTAQITFSNAGHPPPVLLHLDKPYELLETGGTVIGIEEDLPIQEKTVQLKPGDKLVLYTDGVTEYMNEKMELFGTKKFFNLMEENKTKPLEAILEITLSNLKQFGGQAKVNDDVSILILSYDSLNP